MSQRSDLVYSNDLCAAFLTAIVDAFNTFHPRCLLGRTTVQKLTYFAKVLGVPVPCSFGIYTYGPYSDQVTFTIESLLADDVIRDWSRKSQYSNYRPGPNSRELLDAFESRVNPYAGQIDQVVEVLGKFSPRNLELISTLHFTAWRQYHLRHSLSKTSIIDEFRSIKRDKFRYSHISACFDALTHVGLIPADR